jgi:hypothetical protein
VLALVACGDDDDGKKGGGGSKSHRDAGSAGSSDDAGSSQDGGGSAGTGHQSGHDAGAHPGNGGSGGSGVVQLGELGGSLGKPTAKAKWTVFIYGHADHSLSNSFLDDLSEMTNAELSKDVHVVTLADFDASQKIAVTGDRFPDGAQWLEIPGGGADPELLGEEDELNFDDPAVLSAAITAAFKQFPSERRALILWDHGGSWMGGYGGDTQNGTVSEPTPMTAAEVASAVEQGMQDAGLGDEKLDLFSFDTCLMAGAEVVWLFRDLAQMYIANAEIDYGDGWDYTAFLTHLSKHTGDSARALAAKEVDFWDAHHVDASFNDKLLRSHVALDTAALPDFGTAIEDFVQRWLSSQTLSGVELGRASYFSLPPYMNQLESPQSTPELRDIGHFLNSMSGVSDAKLAMAASAARGALENAIVARSQGDLREAAEQLGVHVELPLAANMTKDLLDLYKDRASVWIGASHWYDALLTYGQLDDTHAPSINASISNDQTPDTDHLPTVEFSSSDDDVAEAEVDIALVDSSKPDQLAFFGIIGKSAIDPGNSYQFPWDGQLVGLPDGHGGIQGVYMTIWEDGGPGANASLASVLAIFGIFQTSDGGQALGALLLQDSDAETSLLTLFDPPVTLQLDDVVRDLPGSTFTPVLVSLDLNTQEQSLLPGETLPINGPLPLMTGPAAAGTYALVTSVTDVFGNANADVQVANVPTPIQ